MIDGTRLTDLVNATDTGSTQWLATPFELAEPDPASVLMGDERYEPWMTDASRVPLLACGYCSDLMCAAVMVTVTKDATTVEWSDWAWDDATDGERVALPTLPTCTFNRASTNGLCRRQRA